jgi:hypothetical protein
VCEPDAFEDLTAFLELRQSFSSGFPGTVENYFHAKKQDDSITLFLKLKQISITEVLMPFILKTKGNDELFR